MWNIFQKMRGKATKLRRLIEKKKKKLTRDAEPAGAYMGTLFMKELTELWTVTAQYYEQQKHVVVSPTWKVQSDHVHLMASLSYSACDLEHVLKAY